MGTVFGKNTTASAITVASWTVYFIDSTDAEIVEVEKTSGQALPSVGDTVTFGNYPQATSTPEPIEWTVLAVDSVNGKALLLSKYILDAHVYNTERASVSWGACTLRDWLNNTFFNAAFNSAEQGEIVTTHNTGSGSSSDDKVFCLTQSESESYIPVEADRRAVATQKAIDDGVTAYAPEMYGNWWNLDWDIDSYYRADMIGASGGLSVVNMAVTWVGVRPAMWVSFSGVSITKYNAFKYTLSGTPYWYVIDGVHDTWTDDLSAWGYSEVPVGPVLPTVVPSGFILYGTSDVRSITIASGETHDLYEFGEGKKSFDASKSYAADRWQQYSTFTRNNVTSLQIVNNSGYFAVKNVSSSAITNFLCIVIATCSDPTATVVTVYDSSDNAYNAFKYTASGTDYYYVLDGTQTDWTDDLAGIGYNLYLIGYTSSNGTSSQQITAFSGQWIYDSSGNKVSVSSTATATVEKYYESVSDTTGSTGGLRLENRSGNLLLLLDGGSSSITVQRIEYTVS